MAIKFEFTLNTGEVEALCLLMKSGRTHTMSEIIHETARENRPKVISVLESKLAYFERLENRVFDEQEHVEDSPEFKV